MSRASSPTRVRKIRQWSISEKMRHTGRSDRSEMTYSRITVRFASGDVEHRYETTLPKVGDRLGRNGDEGFVTSVEADGPDHARVTVGTPAPQGVAWDDLTGPITQDDGAAVKARERILAAAYELFSQRGIRAVGTEEV